MALGGEALAALAAAALQDQAAGARRHPLAETVRPGPLDVARLKRPLHGQSSLNILEMNRERLGTTHPAVKVNGADRGETSIFRPRKARTDRHFSTLSVDNGAPAIPVYNLFFVNDLHNFYQRPKKILAADFGPC